MTETCTHCGQPIGDRELKHVWVLGGERYVFHVKKEPNCRAEWTKANKETIAKVTLNSPASTAYKADLAPLEGLMRILKDLTAILLDLVDRLKRIEDELNIPSQHISKGPKKKGPGRPAKKVEK